MTRVTPAPKGFLSASVAALLLVGAAWGCGEGTVGGPRVVSAVAPVFPDVAAQARVSGELVIEIKVDPGGAVTETRIVDGFRLFREMGRTFEATARRWRFEPGGNSVRSARLTFVFRMMPSDTPEEDLAPVFTPPYRVEVRRRPPPLPSVHRDPKGEIVR